MLPSLVRILPLSALQRTTTTTSGTSADLEQPRDQAEAAHEPEDEDPADIFTAALGGMFPDDTQNMHGNPGDAVLYRARALGDVRLRLADPVGEDGRLLFAHYLWNAAILLAELMGCAVGGSGEAGTGTEAGADGDENENENENEDEDERWRDRCREGRLGRHDWRVKGERVVELGAGTGLSGIIAAACGASHVAITDYPDAQILDNISENVALNRHLWSSTGVSVHGHAWGGPTEPLEPHSFARVLAADTLWMEAQHENLASSMESLLARDAAARVWVVAGFHTGRERVAAFFDEVERQGALEVEDIWEVDVELYTREWSTDRWEDAGQRKRWVVVAILKRKET